MAGERNAALIQIIGKILIFQQLAPNQVQKLLGICVARTCETDEVLCAHGTCSEEMFVLISGELTVEAPDGAILTTVKPVTTVGEMGLVTKQERTATIKASKPTRVLVLQRNRFENLLRNDIPAQARIYRNIIGILPDRIVNDNTRMRDHLVEQVQQEERIAEQSRRADMAIKMLAKEAGVPQQAAGARVDGELAETSAFTVLVVDHEAQIRSFLTRALSQYKVIEAGDGNEALEIIQNTPPDLVIADIRMPDMDGFALLGRLRESDPNVPVVAISGFASEEDVIEYDFDGFLAKPIDLETMMQTVEKSLSR